ncbi:MAG: hypothetical protein JXB88_18790 [Spirochaetales bacterium]|nr:hypothetical protein [Spirochaetales bacterium]
MFKKEYLSIFIIIGLAIAYAFISLFVLLTKGKWARAVKRKIAIGTMIITFSAILASGQTAYSWWWPPTPVPTEEPTIVPTEEPTDAPTDMPTPMCYTPTPGITDEPTPTPTPEITDEPTPTPVITPMCYTTGPTVMPTPLITEPTVEPQDPLPCEPDTTIAADFACDGIGEFCWEATSPGSFLNSWGLDLLEINGVDYTNQWVDASTLPAKIDGKYFITYKSTVPWGHFEAKN